MTEPTGFLGISALMPDGSIKPMTDPIEMELACTPDSRRIGWTEVGKYTVSTVFLNIEHPGGYWFETMVFELPSYMDLFADRYKTKAAAVAGHEHVVEQLRAGVEPNDVQVS